MSSPTIVTETARDCASCNQTGRQVAPRPPSADRGRRGGCYSTHLVELGPRDIYSTVCRGGAAQVRGSRVQRLVAVHDAGVGQTARGFAQRPDEGGDQVGHAAVCRRDGIQRSHRRVVGVQRDQPDPRRYRVPAGLPSQGVKRLSNPVLWADAEHMERFDVEFRDRHGICRRSLQVIAGSAGEAVMHARTRVPSQQAMTYAVYRHRRIRGRRLVGYYAGGDDEGGGLAGVREPRRPAPDPGHLSAERDEPADPAGLPELPGG